MRGVPPVGAVVQPARHLVTYWQHRLADRSRTRSDDTFDDQPMPIGVVVGHEDGTYRGYVAKVVFSYVADGSAQEFLLRRGEIRIRRDLAAHPIEVGGEVGWIVTKIGEDPPAQHVADMREHLSRPKPTLDEILGRSAS